MKRLAVLGLCLLAAACGRSELPVRNPLAEGTLTPTASTTIPPIVTATTSPPRDALSAPGELEPAAARATALLAEWLAVAQRDLAVVVAEAVAWPSSCLGVEYPGTVCATVITPGFRVLLRDPLGGLHTLHLDAGSGNARWAGETRTGGTVVAVDRAAQRLTFDAGGRSREVRLVPGTHWLPDIARVAQVGARVVVAYDPSGRASPVAAWIALDPP
jgi:hypothetical protein